MARHKPAAVVLCYGGNDVRKDPRGYAGSIRAIVRTLVQRSIGVRAAVARARAVGAERVQERERGVRRHRFSVDPPLGDADPLVGRTIRAECRALARACLHERSFEACLLALGPILECRRRWNVHTLEELAAVGRECAPRGARGDQIGDYKVERVLVEEQDEIAREFYFAMLVDRATSQVTAIVSTEGGMEIEEVAAHTPEKIFREAIDPAVGFQGYNGRNIAFALGLRFLLLFRFFLVGHQITLGIVSPQREQ